MIEKNAAIMTSNMNFGQGITCLVCSKATPENPVNIYSGLARRDGSIHDQILEIVGNHNTAEACEASEVVCPQCLKLLLNINNMEFELKNLKVEFISIFQMGLGSRKTQVMKTTDYSKVEYEKYSKSENDEKNLLLNYSESEREFRTCALKPDKDDFNDTDIVVDAIRNSFSINHACLSAKESVRLNATRSLPQTRTSDIVDISQQNDKALQKELMHALHLVRESQKKFETDCDLPNRPMVENCHRPFEIHCNLPDRCMVDNDPKSAEPPLIGGQFTMLPNSNNSVEYNKISDIISSNVTKDLEGNVSFDFEHFETRLCTDDIAHKEAPSEEISNKDVRSLRNFESRFCSDYVTPKEAPSIEISSKNIKSPKRKPTDFSDQKAVKGKISLKKDKEATAEFEKDAGRDSDSDDMYNWDDNLHEECRQDEWKRKSCELCKGKVCKICMQAYSSLDELTDHRGRVHGDVYKYVCDKCPNVRYCHKAKLTQHLKLRHNVHIHQCPGCRIEETSQNSLDQHIINKHPDSRYFECEFCNKAFRTYRYLHFVHIKRCHIGLPIKYFCDKCNKGFVDKSSLDNHKYTHSEVKNHACEFCEASFHTPYSLKVHVNTHTQEKKYTCPVCGMSFLRLCNLIGHKKRAHRDKRYVCEICGTQVHTNKELIQHQTSYHNERKPLTCGKCNKSFVNKRNLKEHLQIHHLQDKPYKCYCGKAYVNRSRLRYHCKAVHTTESNQQLSIEAGFLEESNKTPDEDNEEENMVVITVKECNPHAVYSVQTAPLPSHEVMISSDSTTHMELPLLHSPFSTIGSERVGLSTPILFTSLNTNSVEAVQQGQQPVPEDISQSKFEPAVAHITNGIQATVPFHSTPMPHAAAGDQDPLEILPEETSVSHTTAPLTTELLRLPSMRTSTANTVPVTYITAWPT